jgi:hypothetical protein
METEVPGKKTQTCLKWLTNLYITMGRIKLTTLVVIVFMKFAKLASSLLCNKTNKVHVKNKN